MVELAPALRSMSKSPKQVAQRALQLAKASLPAYSAVHSPKFYTQHQLFAVSALRQFFRTDYRGIEAILKDSSDLRQVLGLKRVPHFSTIRYAELRLFKGGVLVPAFGVGEDGQETRAAG